MLFRRAFSTCPSCIPARYALLTGLFPQTSGVVGFAAKPITDATLPAAARRCRLCDRARRPGDAPGARQRICGYQKEIRGSTYVDDDDYDQSLKQAAPDTGGIRKVVAGSESTFNGWQANAVAAGRRTASDGVGRRPSRARKWPPRRPPKSRCS